MNKNKNIVYQICGRTSLVKNLPSNAEDLGSISGRGTKIPHATGQLSLRATNTEPACSRAHTVQLERNLHNTMKNPMCCSERYAMLQQKFIHAAKKIPCATTKTGCSQVNKYFKSVGYS